MIMEFLAASVTSVILDFNINALDSKLAFIQIILNRLFIFKSTSGPLFALITF